MLKYTFMIDFYHKIMIYQCYRRKSRDFELIRLQLFEVFMLPRL